MRVEIEISPVETYAGKDVKRAAYDAEIGVYTLYFEDGTFANVHKSDLDVEEEVEEVEVGESTEDGESEDEDTNDTNDADGTEDTNDADDTKEPEADPFDSGETV